MLLYSTLILSSKLQVYIQLPDILYKSLLFQATSTSVSGHTTKGRQGLLNITAELSAPMIHGTQAGVW